MVLASLCWSWVCAWLCVSCEGMTSRTGPSARLGPSCNVASSIPGSPHHSFSYNTHVSLPKHHTGVLLRVLHPFVPLLLCRGALVPTLPLLPALAPPPKHHRKQDLPPPTHPPFKAKQATKACPGAVPFASSARPGHGTCVAPRNCLMKLGTMSWTWSNSVAPSIASTSTSWT